MYVLIDPSRAHFPRGDWIPFLLFGPLPFAAAFAWIWIRQGFEQEPLRIAKLPKSTVSRIEKLLAKNYDITTKGYSIDPRSDTHEFTIERQQKIGRLIFTQQFASSLTQQELLHQLCGFELRRQLEDFGDKQITIKASGILVQFL